VTRRRLSATSRNRRWCACSIAFDDVVRVFRAAQNDCSNCIASVCRRAAIKGWIVTVPSKARAPRFPGNAFRAPATGKTGWSRRCTGRDGSQLGFLQAVAHAEFHR
jgi:hypothetical protein